MIYRDSFNGVPHFDSVCFHSDWKAIGSFFMIHPRFPISSHHLRPGTRRWRDIYHLRGYIFPRLRMAHPGEVTQRNYHWNTMINFSILDDYYPFIIPVRDWFRKNLNCDPQSETLGIGRGMIQRIVTTNSQNQLTKGSPETLVAEDCSADEV